MSLWKTQVQAMGYCAPQPSPGSAVQRAVCQAYSDVVVYGRPTITILIKDSLRLLSPHMGVMCQDVGIQTLADPHTVL